MMIENYSYKKDFSLARAHHTDFWNKNGIALHIDIKNPKSQYQINNDTFVAMHNDSELMAKNELLRIENNLYFGDTLPILAPDYGTVTLATILGARNVYDDCTIGYNPCIKDIDKFFDWDFKDDNEYWNMLEQKCMSDHDLFKKFTLQSMLDELDVIEKYDIPERRSHVSEITEKQKKLYQCMGVASPT